MQTYRSRPFVGSLLFTLSLLLVPQTSLAWGKRGHALVAETAAMIASDQGKTLGFLRNHAYDLGYYANVPDLVWKKPETYKVEWTQHFMDLEIFERGTKGSQIEKPYELSRAEFDKSFPQVPDSAGRAFWRIRELNTKLEEVAAELKKTDLTKEKRHQLQAEWLVVAGAIGHYVADLAQPLHVTENYDGQLTEQKGIHAFYEDAVLDDYPPGEIENEVGKEAARLSRAFLKKNSGKPLLAMLEDLAQASNRELPEILKTDKRIGRKDVKKARLAYRRMHVGQMALGSLYLAEIWMRPTAWTYDGEKFFTFVSTPEYIAPATK